MSAEFLGLIVLGMIQIGQFWFSLSRHKRDESAVNRAELKESEERSSEKIQLLRRDLISLEHRIDRKSDAWRDEVRKDLSDLFELARESSALNSKIEKGLEIAERQMTLLHQKFDNLTRKP